MLEMNLCGQNTITHTSSSTRPLLRAISIAVISLQLISNKKINQHSCCCIMEPLSQELQGVTGAVEGVTEQKMTLTPLSWAAAAKNCPLTALLGVQVKCNDMSDIPCTCNSTCEKHFTCCKFKYPLRKAIRISRLLKMYSQRSSDQSIYSFLFHTFTHVINSPSRSRIFHVISRFTDENSNATRSFIKMQC